jgi:hypothetical protein
MPHAARDIWVVFHPRNLTFARSGCAGSRVWHVLSEWTCEGSAPAGRREVCSILMISARRASRNHLRSTLRRESV